MKRWGIRVAAAGLAALPLALMAPAQAAGPYTIVGGGYGSVAGGSIRAFMTASIAGRCAEVATSPLNGTDARFIDVTALGLAGHGRTLNWSATATSPVLGSLRLFFYTAACQALPYSPEITSPSAGISIPGDAKWMVVVANNTVNVTFSF